MNSMEERRNALLEDVAQFIAARLSEDLCAHPLKSLGPGDAEAIAYDLADHLADYWGGQLINFPKDYRRRLARRELEILGDFNGNNWGELARRYDFSVRGLRKLILRVQERIRKGSDDRTRDMFQD